MRLIGRLLRRITGRSNGSSRRTTTAASPVIRAPSTATHPSVIPDGSKRLNEGVVIQTSLLARVLGVKLLTLDGTVLVSPARLQEPDNDPEETPKEVSRPSAERGNAVPGPNGVVGTRLLSTARLLEANASDLRDLRSTSESTRLARH